MTENINMTSGDPPEVPKVTPREDAGKDDAAEVVVPPLFVGPRAAAKMSRPETGERAPAEDPDEIVLSEDDRKQREWALKLGNLEIEAGDLKDAVIGIRMPKNIVEEQLLALGHSAEKVAKVMESADQFASDLDRETEEPLPEEDSMREALSTETEELADIKEKTERGEGLSEPEIARVKKAESKLHKLLYDEELGLFRRKDRFRRLFVKPVVGGLFAAIITYMILLNAMTKNAQKRGGSG